MNAARIGAGLIAKPWLLLEFTVAHMEFVHTLGKKWSFLLPRAAVGEALSFVINLCR